jgi:excisionase family DNA binding protein
MAAVPSGKEWFTAPQVARILGVQTQSVYDAVKDGRMSARGTGWDRRIEAQEVIGYAIRTGRDVNAVVARMQEICGDIEWGTLLGWVLAAVGLYWLIKKLND